jgi:hypothetical protein
MECAKLPLARLDPPMSHIIAVVVVLEIQAEMGAVTTPFAHAKPK